MFLHLRRGPILAAFLLVTSAAAEAPPEDDGKFDLSERLKTAHGFVPVPIIITEPALGGFGGGLALVFLEERGTEAAASGQGTPIRPDLTAVAAGYTENDSWFAGAGRSATLEQIHLRYRVGVAKADLNLDFYDSLPSGDDVAFTFNVRSIPLYLSAGRLLRDNKLFIGGQYVFAKTELEFEERGSLPPFADEQDLDSTVSSLGLVAEFDGRDSIFTPDRGLKVHAHYNWSDDWLGSDYRFGRMDAHAYWYTPVRRNWISGLRAEWLQAFDEPPFYLLPYVAMRGIPALRYQGKVSLLAETEQRIDVTPRWSAVVFGGLGKAFDDADDFSDADLVYGYGAGGRYLIARQFKLRMGLDVARGPEEWAYYVIFGSAWLK